MQYNSPALKIQGTDAFVSPHEIFFLGYPIESSMQDFIFDKVIAFNCSRNPRYRKSPPVQFIVGTDLVKSAFTNKNFNKSPKGLAIISTSRRPDEILARLYNQLKETKSSCVILSGFSNISFNSKSADERKNEIEYFINQLRIVQRLFLVPILIATKVSISNAENHACVPALTLGETEFEITTDRQYSLTAPIGFYKLYHVVRSTETPVSCLFKENLTGIKHG